MVGIILITILEPYMYHINMLDTNMLLTTSAPAPMLSESSKQRRLMGSSFECSLCRVADPTHKPNPNPPNPECGWVWIGPDPTLIGMG